MEKSLEGSSGNIKIINLILGKVSFFSQLVPDMDMVYDFIHA